MMGHCTQLARWLHKQLSLKFTFGWFPSFGFNGIKLSRSW